MMKLTNSQQVENEKTEGILQQVESDATLPFLERSVSLKIIPALTQGDDHVAGQDADDDENQGQAMSDVQESLQLKEPREIHVRPVGAQLT